MMNAGVKWQVCIQGRPEVMNASATVFLVVFDITDETDWSGHAPRKDITRDA